MNQEQALDILKLGWNVFLTGAAGAGKTYLLNQYIQFLRDHGVPFAVTASTGIAATHLQGQTIHSWSGIGIKDRLTEKDVDTICQNRRINKLIRKTKVLIIDEISMLHADQLQMVDWITKEVRLSDHPFGGLQVVLCGDFFQLPPVVTNGRPVRFAFESSAWQKAEFAVCYLAEQHRQNDSALLQILNDIRNGAAGEHTKVPLRTCYKAEIASTTTDAEPTLLFAKNVNVDAINEQALEALPGNSEHFEMTATGFPALVTSLKRNCLAPELLTLKVGAQVMFVKNSRDGCFVNGTRGVVTALDEVSGWPTVETLDGTTLEVHPEDWNIEDDGIIRAKITQLPLRLAWAITIHKSQGMTLDAAEMNLSDTFEPGMGYVALSRVKSLQSLRLMGLNDMALQVNQKVLAQDEKFLLSSLAACRVLDGFSPEEKQTEQRKCLLERFEGTADLVTRSHDKKTDAQKNKKAKKASYRFTVELLQEGAGLATIEKERQIKVSTILSHLEKAKGRSELPSLDPLKSEIPSDSFTEIMHAFANSSDGKLAPIHEQLQKKYSFELIRTVRLFFDPTP